MSYADTQAFDFSVLIEPLWNWNPVSTMMPRLRSTVLIEPLWNWNRQESDRYELRYSLNRTFMELKSKEEIEQLRKELS